MNSELINVILLSLVPMFGFGISNAMQKLYVERLGPAKLITYRGLTIVSILLVYWLFNLTNSNLDLQQMLLGAFVAFISYFGLFFLNKSLQDGKVGLVIPVSSSRVLISAIVGIAFLGEQISGLQLLMVLLIFVGVFAAVINFNDLASSNIFSFKSGVPYALLAAFFWGITFPLFGGFSAILGAALFSLIAELTVTVVSVAQQLLQKKSLALSKEEFKLNWAGVGTIGVLGAIAAVFMNTAYATGYYSIVTAITAASPVVSIIFGILIFKEKLSLQQLIAIILILIGIVALPLV
jgi:transporter family protein